MREAGFGRDELPLIRELICEPGRKLGGRQIRCRPSPDERELIPTGAKRFAPPENIFIFRKNA
jgi:hypothetical protein